MSNDWLTRQEVEEQYGIKNASLEYWRTYGCPALNGAKPRVKKVASAGPRDANLYLLADLETILAVPATHGRFQDGAAVWIDSKTAEIDFGVRRPALQRARRSGSPFLGGRKIRARKILTVARGGVGESRRMRLWFYLEEDVKRIAAGQDESPVTAGPAQWLTAGQAKRQFGFLKSALLHWRVNCCVYLSGRKIGARKAKVILPNQSGERSAWVYSFGDLKTIAERKAQGHEVAFTDGEGDWWSAAKIQRAFGIPPNRLAYWRNKGWPGRPGWKVRAKQIATPPEKPNGKAHDRAWVYHSKDIALALTIPDARTTKGRELKTQTNAVDLPQIRSAKTESQARRGRRVDPTNHEIQQFCYLQMKAGIKRRIIRLQAGQRWGLRAPKGDSEVTILARRYALREGQPWPPRG